jgi:uncharacterized phage protein (TIGR02220 family)
MRKREIHQDFWRSLDISNLDYFERILFIALWGAADREGLVLNRADRIKADAFPLDEKTTISVIAKGIESLALSGLIELLSSSNGDKYTCIHIINFMKYQHIHPNEAKSVLKCNYITGNVIECGEMSLMPLMPFIPSSPSSPSCLSGESPRKRGGASPVRSGIPTPDLIAIIDHLNQVTGKRHSHDKGNAMIEGALKRGATVAECKQVIDHLWATWSPEWRQRIDKTTPFRPANFDRYLDEAGAGAASTAEPEDPEKAARMRNILDIIKKHAPAATYGG